MHRTISVALLFLSLLYGCRADAQSLTPTGKTLTVGTKQAPPFAIKRANGSWYGISIDLWRAIANDLGMTYELHEYDLQGLLSGVQDGSLDLAVAALTITAEREKRMDFTHAFYTTGLGIAIPRGQKNGGLGFIRSFLSWGFLQIIAALGLILLLVGVLVWLSERKKNPQQFGAGLDGIWSGFWWSAVTLTTVGYGDKAPQTLTGRLLALIWMFTGLIIVSSFIAAVTTALTVSQLTSGIKGPQDLARAWVATVPGSTSEAYLRQHYIALKHYPTPLAGLRGVVAGEVDAMVYDAPLLRYLATTEIPGEIEVLPTVFERQAYGITLPTGSHLREPINRVLLDKIHQPEWHDTLNRYLGR